MIDSLTVKEKLNIAVGLSGGVDSAVAAALLVEQGHSVIGITMKIWNGSIRVAESAKQACFGPDEDEDVETCQKLCAKLGIDYRAIDLASEYGACVLDYFRREYRQGRTPNPCIVCNSEMKFGFLIERAHALGLDFDYFATGHYARIEQSNTGSPRLRSALDGAKDQSYFLYRLGPAVLAQVLFPLGELRKDQVRDAARRFGLDIADKPESQDFIAGGDYSPLFTDKAPEAGDIVGQDGKVLGRHRGLPFYTIGQRRGLGIGASEKGGDNAEPLYVLALDPEKNRVVVGPNRGLFSVGLHASSFITYDVLSPDSPMRGLAKIRQNQRPVPCSFTPSADGRCLIAFDESLRAVAPGQSVVIYDEEGYVLGGGIIENAF